jgi:hypothetical protein
MFLLSLHRSKKLNNPNVLLAECQALNEGLSCAPNKGFLKILFRQISLKVAYFEIFPQSKEQIGLKKITPAGSSQTHIYPSPNGKEDQPFRRSRVPLHPPKLLILENELQTSDIGNFS